MGRSQNISMTTCWKKLVPTAVDDLERVKTSVQGPTADVVAEIARELEFLVEPEDLIELL